MALVSCPDCGAQVSDAAMVCAKCGFPLRRDALAAATRGGGGAGGRSSAGTTAIIIGIVGAGIVGLVVVGILAAIAIPRFTMASQRAKEKEGEGLLKQAYTLENAYYANNGAYAATLEELRTVGWEDLPTLHYTVDIRLGPNPTDICLEARPKQGADVQPLSMDSAGVMFHDEGCAGETVAESRASAYAPPEPMDDVPGESGDAGARKLLGEVYLGVAEYRAENGRDPTALNQVVRHVHFTRASSENTVVVGQSSGRVCVSAAPNTNEAGHNAFSVDGEGRLYAGIRCSGAVLEQFSALPPGDSASVETSEDKPS